MTEENTEDLTTPQGAEDEPELAVPGLEPDDPLAEFYDVPLRVSVVFGKTAITVKEFLEIKDGHVVELDKLAGEPIEVCINGRVFARGEAIVVNEKFAVRLTDIVEQKELES